MGHGRRCKEKGTGRKDDNREKAGTQPASAQGMKGTGNQCFTGI